MIEKVVSVLGGVHGKWLDVGFGNGCLLTTAKEFGFDVCGLDPRIQAVDSLRESGLEAHALTIDAFESDDTFSVVSMADVLEHMPFPRTALRKAHRLLEPSGVLFLSMPNRDAPIWKQSTAANWNPFWNEIEHYHNFGREQLYSLLEQHGFEPAAYGISERYYMCMEVIAVKNSQ